MIFRDTKLVDAYVIELEPRADDRGFFARSFCEREFVGFTSTDTPKTTQHHDAAAPEKSQR